MTKPVHRYMRYLDIDRPDIAANCKPAGIKVTQHTEVLMVLASDYEALLAERDARIAELELLLKRVRQKHCLTSDLEAEIDAALAKHGGDV